ncbi:hypothetical protein JTB14_023238 [Gonioctena quinquepunctata]|nr:hypothetical protein JTB14_023238 [Gonioctena quinquepunctata]
MASAEMLQHKVARRDGFISRPNFENRMMPLNYSYDFKFEDEATVFSECEGDSDAEYGEILENLQKKNHPTRASTSETRFCGIESEDESNNDFDSDESIADPNNVMQRENEKHSWNRH